MRTFFLRAALVAALAFGATAQAQVFRAYLASNGNDANACSIAAPCRLLPRALDVVASGGEVWMLDSANYNTGTVTIAKSVKILAAPGALGSLVAGSGHALMVLASGLDISLANLSIGPLPGAVVGAAGLFMNAASTVTIENSLIANVPGSAIVIWGGGRLKVTGSVLRDNGTVGVALDGGSIATIHATRMLGNAGGGVNVGSASASPTVANVSQCVISGGNYGLFTNATTADAVARITATDTVIRYTTNAVRVAAPFNVGTSRIDLGGSLIADNEWGWVVFGTGAAFHSLGDNQVSGNGGVSGLRSGLGPE